MASIRGQQAQPGSAQRVRRGPSASRGRGDSLGAGDGPVAARPSFADQGDAHSSCGARLTAKWGPRAVNELFTYLGSAHAADRVRVRSVK